MKRYIYHLGGRLESVHRKEGKSAKKMDCLLRAISLALNIPYDEIWETRLPIGLDDIMILEEFAKLKGITLERIQTIFKGQKRKMTAFDFPAEGRYLLRQANHLVAYIDGDLLDSFDSSQRAVYYAYKITF